MKFCRKCGKSFKNYHVICDVCGIELNKVIDNFTSTSDSIKSFNINKKFSNALFLFIGIITITITLAFSISIKKSTSSITSNVIRAQTECPYECCYNQTEYKNKLCASDQQCTDNKCIKPECPYECCTEDNYLPKTCDSNYECKDNKCVAKETNENIFDCSQAKFDVSYVNCSSKNQELKFEIINTGKVDLWGFSVDVFFNHILYSNSTGGPNKNNPLKPSEKTTLVYGCDNKGYCTQDTFITTLKIIPSNYPSNYLERSFSQDEYVTCFQSTARVIKNRTTEDVTDYYCKRVDFDVSDIDCYNTGGSAVNVSISVSNKGSVSISPIFLFTSSGKEECKAMFKDSIGNGATQSFKINCTDYGFDNTDYLNVARAEISNCQNKYIEKELSDECK